MKALGILKEPYSAMPKDGGGFIFSYTSKEIQEAIAELEALQLPKTCEGCEYKHNTYNECTHNTLLQSDDDGYYVNFFEIPCADFYCSLYKPKDTSCEN